MFAGCCARFSDCLFRSKGLFPKGGTIITSMAVMAYLVRMRLGATHPREATDAMSDDAQLLLGFYVCCTFLKNFIELLEDNAWWCPCLICCRPLPMLHPTEVRWIH